MRVVSVARSDWMTPPAKSVMLSSSGLTICRSSPFSPAKDLGSTMHRRAKTTLESRGWSHWETYLLYS